MLQTALIGIQILHLCSQKQPRQLLKLPPILQINPQLGLCTFVKSQMVCGSAMTVVETQPCGSIIRSCNSVELQTFSQGSCLTCLARVYSLILLLLLLMQPRRMVQRLLCGHSLEEFQIYCQTSTPQTQQVQLQKTIQKLY